MNRVTMDNKACPKCHNLFLSFFLADDEDSVETWKCEICGHEGNESEFEREGQIPPIGTFPIIRERSL